MLIYLDIVKWSIILCVAALLLYFILPKYKFMGPNNLAVYKCNMVTGEVLVWDIDNETWETPSRKTISKLFTLKND